MANLDVTELFTDPDFVDEGSLILRTAAVSSRGENFIKETARPIVGSFQPATGRALKRLPPALLSENVMSFWTNGVVPTTEGCDYPSVLLFRGKRYQIRQTFDWTNWGPGWTECICVAEKLV